MFLLYNLKHEENSTKKKKCFVQMLDGYVGMLSPPTPNLSLLLFELLTLFGHTQAPHQQGHGRALTFSAASVFQTCSTRIFLTQKNLLVSSPAVVNLA